MTVDEIKQGYFDQLNRRDLLIIETTNAGFTVHKWFPDGVCPPTDYDTAPEAIARAMQLLEVKQIVGPQDWPETAVIGEIS